VRRLKTRRGADRAPTFSSGSSVQAVIEFDTRQITKGRRDIVGEIAQLLEQRGLSPDQAQEAENAVIQLVKSKVPPQFQGVLDALLGSSQAAVSSDAVPSAEPGGLGGLLGVAEGLLGEHNG
jgi:hypothetical protein